MHWKLQSLASTTPIKSCRNSSRDFNAADFDVYIDREWREPMEGGDEWDGSAPALRGGVGEDLAQCVGESGGQSGVQRLSFCETARICMRDQP